MIFGRDNVLLVIPQELGGAFTYQSSYAPTSTHMSYRSGFQRPGKTRTSWKFPSVCMHSSGARLPRSKKTLSSHRGHVRGNDQCHMESAGSVGRHFLRRIQTVGETDNDTKGGEEKICNGSRWYAGERRHRPQRALVNLESKDSTPRFAGIMIASWTAQPRPSCEDRDIPAGELRQTHIAKVVRSWAFRIPHSLPATAVAADVRRSVK